MNQMKVFFELTPEEVELGINEYEAAHNLDKNSLEVLTESMKVWIEGYIFGLNVHKQNAEKYEYLRDNAKEVLLNPRAFASEFCPDMRTKWEIPILICSGPIGGYIDFDKAVEIMMNHDT